MKCLTFLSLLIASGFCEAALPPFYESLNEYRALLASPELTNHFNSGELILDIQRTAQGFVITTNQQKVSIERVLDPLERPGPARFHFVFPLAQPKS